MNNVVYIQILDSEGKSNSFQALCYIISSIIGIGFLTIPAQIKNTGLVLGVSTIIFTGLCSLYGSFLMTRAYRLYRVPYYSALTKLILGQNVAKFLSLILVIYLQFSSTIFLAFGNLKSSPFGKRNLGTFRALIFDAFGGLLDSLAQLFSFPLSLQQNQVSGNDEHFGLSFDRPDGGLSRDFDTNRGNTGILQIHSQSHACHWRSLLLLHPPILPSVHLQVGFFHRRLGLLQATLPSLLLRHLTLHSGRNQRLCIVWRTDTNSDTAFLRERLYQTSVPLFDAHSNPGRILHKNHKQPGYIAGGVQSRKEIPEGLDLPFVPDSAGSFPLRGRDTGSDGDDCLAALPNLHHNNTFVDEFAAGAGTENIEAGAGSHLCLLVLRLPVDLRLCDIV